MADLPLSLQPSAPAPGEKVQAPVKDPPTVPTENNVPAPVNTTGVDNGTVVSVDRTIKRPGDKGAAAPRLDPTQADLFDTASGQRVVAKDHADLESGILDGRYGYGPTKQINVLDKDGNLSHVDSKYLQWSLKNGYSVESADQAAVRQYLSEHEGLSGDAEVALGQFADEALLGIPETILDHTTDPLEVAKREAIKKDHVVANTLGGLAGFLASTELGSPLFKGASTLGKGAETLITGEKAIEAAKTLEVGAELAKTGMKAAEIAKVAPGLARTIIGKGIGLGVEGAVISSPKALTEAALGDPEEAAESLVHGFGMGAAFGVAGGLFKGVAGKLPALSSVAEERAFQALKPSKTLSDAAKEVGGSKGVGRAMLDNDLVRRTGESLDSYAARINEAKSEIGTRSETMWSKLDASAQGKTGLKSGEEIADLARRKIIDPLNKIPGNKPVANKIESYLSEFAEKGGKEPMTFQQLHQYRAKLDELIASDGTAARKELSSVRDIITKELETKGDAVASKTGFRFKESLDQYNTLYKQLHVASQAAEQAAANKVEHAGFDIGLGTVYGAISHNPLAVLKGLAGSKAQQWIKENGNSAAARVLNYLAGKGGQRGLLIAEESMAKTAGHMDRLPKILAGLTNGFREKAVPGIITAGLRASDPHKLTDQVALMMSDPAALKKAIDVLSGEITHGGAPNIGDAYAAKQLNILNYLHDALPKPKAPQSAFAGPPPKPSSKEVATFARKVEVADDWTKVLQHLQSGTLHQDHVDAFNAVYPKTAARLKGRVKQVEMSPFAKPLPSNVRQQLGLITGETYGTKKVPTSFFQQVYQDQASKKQSTANNKFQSLPSMQTGIGGLTDGPFSGGGGKRHRGR